jgi:hypothetical protein
MGTRTVIQCLVSKLSLGRRTAEVWRTYIRVVKEIHMGIRSADCGLHMLWTLVLGCLLVPWISEGARMTKLNLPNDWLQATSLSTIARLMVIFQSLEAALPKFYLLCGVVPRSPIASHEDVRDVGKFGSRPSKSADHRRVDESVQRSSAISN